jgi:phage terminase large subunit-like protein
VLQRLKGWGKDPLLAVMSLVEFVGPSRFAYWGSDGEPIARPHPQAWVQVAATSRDQTRNTMTLMPGLMSNRLIAEYGIKAGAELIRAHGGRVRLEAVTSSYRALEGGRSTFTVLNEIQHWVSGNNGHLMYETVDGNSTKTNSRYLAITNAYLPGEDSVGERMRDSFEKIQAGRAVDVGFLYDSVEADPRTPLTEEALRIVLPQIRGDATWLNIDAIVQSVLDLTISPARSRRMWLNQVVADDDAVFSPADWAHIERETLLEPGDPIVIGFDGGLTHDSTALVAVRISDGTAFVLGLWERPDGPAGQDWIVDRNAVDAAVRDAFRVWDVQAMYCDVAYWESHIEDWGADFGPNLKTKASGRNPVAWDMRSSLKRATAAHERLIRAVLDKKIGYDGDRQLRRHALNARRRINHFGVFFGKESRETPKRVDLYAALMLAHEAYCDVRIKNAEAQRSGRSYFL